MPGVVLPSRPCKFVIDFPLGPSFQEVDGRALAVCKALASKKNAPCERKKDPWGGGAPENGAEGSLSNRRGKTEIGALAKGGGWCDLKGFPVE